MRLSAWAHLQPGVSAKDVRIYLSDPQVSADAIATWTLTPDSQRLSLCIPGDELPSDRPITLTFKAERSYSPVSIEYLRRTRKSSILRSANSPSKRTPVTVPADKAGPARMTPP